MVGPIEKKSEENTPAIWDDAERAWARGEHYNVISSKNLELPDDKPPASESIALTRNWLDIQPAQAAGGTAEEKTLPTREANSKKDNATENRFTVKLGSPEFPRIRRAWGMLRNLTLPDIVFLHILIAITGCVTLLSLLASPHDVIRSLC